MRAEARGLRLGLLLLTSLTPGPLHAQHLLVVTRATDDVAVVDLEDGSVVGRIPTGTFPHEITVANGRAFVPAYGGHTVTAFRTGEPPRSTSFSVAPHDALHGVRTSHDGSRLWVTAENADAVLELDAEDGTLLCIWPTRASRSHMITSTPDDRRLYVANIDSGSVSVIDRSTGDVRVIPTGEGAEGIDVNPGGNEVWVSNRGDNTVSVIDTSSDSVVAVLETAGEFPVKLRFRPDGAEVWVANNRSATVAVFDARTRERVALLEVGERPLGLAFSEAGNLAYVSHPGADEILEIDADRKTLRRRIPVEGSPDGIAWVPPDHGPVSR